jgi:hypothetical protein
VQPNPSSLSASGRYCYRRLAASAHGGFWHKAAEAKASNLRQLLEEQRNCAAGKPGLRYPTTGLAGCCARAASGPHGRRTPDKSDEFPSPHGAPEVLGTQAREDSAKYERLVRELNITMS